MIPVHFTWRKIEMINREGEIIEIKAMIPLARFANVSAAQFTDEMQYRMEVEHVQNERSDPSHKRYMASVGEAWRNLPENMAIEYPTIDHLRKRALIKCGFYHMTTTVFDTTKDAARAAAQIKPMDEFGIVVVKKNVVTHYRAKSQKYLRAGGMDKKEFMESSEAVLALLAPYIGISKAALKKEGEKP